MIELIVSVLEFRSLQKSVWRRVSWLIGSLFAACMLLLVITPASATVAITTSTNATTIANAIAAGNPGITLTGTPTLTVGASTNVSGTFTTTGSNLGIAGGIVLGTGNLTQIPGSPIPAGNLSTAGSAISNGPTNEFDIATFSFSFIPKPGVNRMSIASVFASEEYNEYANTQYTDNFTMILNGGIYANTNVATIPGTSTGTDINTVNLTVNSGFYRDNTIAAPPLNDIKMDGATTVFINAFNVVPGTTYTVTIRIADVFDALYDSVVFVSTSTILNNPPALDLSNAVAGTGYTTTYDQGGAPVAIAAADDKISDDGTTISSATITLNSPVAGDQLTAGSLPGGIVASAYNSGTGVLTLTGVATLADYQTALQNVFYSSTGTPTGPANTISVVINDGVDNSNTAIATINMATLSVTKSAANPTVALGASTTLTDAGDTITYTYVVSNTGNLNLTTVAPVDPGPKFNGVNGTGTLGAFTPVSATVAAGGSQTFTAVYTLTAADVVNGAGVTNGVTNTAKATGRDPANTVATSANANASTTIATVAGISLTKAAAAPTIAAGTNPAIIDAGDTITFTYTIKNVGSVALTQAFPSDVGPKFNAIAGTNALSAFSPAAPVNLAIGAQQVFTATYTLSALDVSRGVGITNGVTNTANATAKNGATTINAPAANASTTIPAAPTLTITKSALLNDISGGTAGRADLNETVTYTYVVVNNGNVPLTNVQVKDMHGTPAVQIAIGPGGVASETLSVPGPLGAGASPDGTANDGIWGTLAPGATTTFTYVHTVTQAEINNG